MSSSRVKGLSEKIAFSGKLALGEAMDVSNTDYRMNERVKIIENCRGHVWEKYRRLFCSNI